jgi:hypothetical protein
MASLQPALAELVENHTSRAKACMGMEADDDAGAVREGSRGLEILPELAELSVVRGQALLNQVPRPGERRTFIP